jgi:hypothetical protein
MPTAVILILRHLVRNLRVENEPVSPLAHDSIRARVAEIQARAAERTEVTVASLTKQLIEDRDFARSLDNAAAAVTASAAIMKLHGLGSEKVKVETQPVLDYLTDLSRQDIPVEAAVEDDAIH